MDSIMAATAGPSRSFTGRWPTRDLSITIGHFYTIAGYEVVPAPDNFFFSHAYTFDLTEPFTHTGVLTSYAVDERWTLYNGWTLGWDTGFDQRDQGNTYLGGVKIAPREGCSFTYITSIGNLGERGRSAYAHFIVADLDLTERLNYVFQSDLLQVNETGENTVGINQYLIYTLSDALAVGSRVEWWKADGINCVHLRWSNRTANFEQLLLRSHDRCEPKTARQFHRPTRDSATTGRHSPTTNSRSLPST